MKIFSIFITNFRSVLRRFKVATILSILGLSMAFAAFLVLMMQVSYEWSYDRFHKNADRIYRVEPEYIINPESEETPQQTRMAILARPLADAFVSTSPHIIEGALIHNWANSEDFIIEHENQRKGFKETVYRITPSYLRMFDFKLIEGNVSAMEKGPDKVIIPESMAKKFFGSKPATGQYMSGEGWQNEIVGVYRDFPGNSSVENVIYRKIRDNEGVGEWYMRSYECYVLIDDPKNAETITSNFHIPDEAGFKGVHLLNLPDIYYSTDTGFDNHVIKGSRTQVQILFFIAFLVIIIAAINFVNFSNAIVPIRLRSVNTQKVLGCPVYLLRISMMIEAIIICLLSFGVGVGIFEILSKTSFAFTVGGGLNLGSNVSLLAGTGVLAIIVGIVSGLYPARYITSFPPALVLNGNFGLSARGKVLRNILVGFQFTVSFALIIIAIFVILQNSYMFNPSSLGFDKEQIVVLKLNDKLRKQPELLRQRLTALSEINEIAHVNRVPGEGNETNVTGFNRDYLGKDINFRLIATEPSILKVLGISVTGGRDFIPEDRIEGAFIFNEIAQKQFNLEAGNILTHDWQADWDGVHYEEHSREIIAGFMPDIRYNSFFMDSEPFAFYVADPRSVSSNELIRINAGVNYPALVEKIRETLKEIDPDYTLDIHLYDEILENLYLKELRMGQQISFFSLVAILISLVGIFGMVLFESAYKRKEIGIRKVFGATAGNILRMFNRVYIRILCICFVIAAPFAWFTVIRWLENFVYRTPVYWWVFAIAFIAVGIITIAIVTFQNWRVANINPVDSIKKS
jgi:putative ABC transport system permease protein